MRLIKMLGLAATAVLAVMALVGPSSAMAEKEALLCEQTVHNDPCTAVKHVHFLSVVKNPEGLHVGGKGKLLAGSNTTECNVLILGDVIEPLLASPIKILADLTYTNCNLGCSLAAPGGGTPHGVLDILLTALDLATVIGLGFELKLTCPFIYTCDYNSENLTGHLHHLIGSGTAGEEASTHITYTGASITLKEKLAGPFNCPTTGALDLLLESLTPLHVKE